MRRAGGDARWLPENWCAQDVSLVCSGPCLFETKGTPAPIVAHPLITTLGTSTILAGAALLITRQPSGSVPLFFEDFGYGRLGPVPFGMMFVILLYVIVGFMLWHTTFGARIYAIGDNEAAGAVSGLPVKQTKVAICAVSGLLCAVAANRPGSVGHGARYDCKQRKRRHPAHVRQLLQRPRASSSNLARSGPEMTHPCGKREIAESW